MLSLTIVDACTARGVYRLDFVKGVSYIAHADPSGGSVRFSFTFAIGHVEGDIGGILDVLLERRPPFYLTSVVLEICEVLHDYSVYECHGRSLCRRDLIQRLSQAWR